MQFLKIMPHTCIHFIHSICVVHFFVKMFRGEAQPLGGGGEVEELGGNLPSAPHLDETPVMMFAACDCSALHRSHCSLLCCIWARKWPNRAG